MIKPELLKILVCPETRTALHEAAPELVQRLNQKIADGILKNRRGERITTPLSGALLREDGKVAYPVAGNIPILLVEDSILIEA